MDGNTKTGNSSSEFEMNFYCLNVVWKITILTLKGRLTNVSVCDRYVTKMVKTADYGLGYYSFDHCNI